VNSGTAVSPVDEWWRRLHRSNGTLFTTRERAKWNAAYM